MSRKLTKSMNRVLAGILALLGFAGCEIDSGRVEYGSPHADYTVKGKVVDKVTKNPIQGIRVKLGYTPESSSTSVTTDAEGDFKLTDGSTYAEVLNLYVDDIDGEENGLYTSEQFLIDFSEAEHTGGSGWYRGEYTVTKNVALTEAEPQE